MSTKLSKEDVKSPDQVLKTLNQGFQWSQNHLRALLLGLTVFIVVGIGWVVMDNMSEKKETQAQEAYFPIEKAYLDKKRDFEEAERSAQRPPAKDSKETPKAKATGVMEQDYGTEIAGFKKVMESYPDSKAAQMAALNLSELYVTYKKLDEAAQTLEKMATQSKGGDLISAVLIAQYGNVLSEKADCSGAVAQWQKVLTQSKVSFLHDTLRLKSAFCYEQMNDLAKAEELYKKVSQNSQDPKNPEAGEAGLGRDAEKYLRLLKLKKNAG